nr:DMT family transporter [Alsobacter ponti]
MEPERRASTLKGIAFALGAYFFFATSDALMKAVVGAYSTFQLIPMQVAFAIIPVMAMVLRDGGFRLPRNGNLGLVALRGALSGLGAIFGLYAFRHLPLADVYALAFCAPLLVTVMAIPILGEKVGARRWAAATVGFVGVLVMVRPGFQELSLGHGAALLTAFSGAATLLIMRHLRGIESASTMASAVMLGLLAVSLPVVPFVWRAPALADVGALALSGLLMGSAQFLMLRALSHASAAAVAPMQYTMMVWGVLYGMFVFGNPLNVWVVAGCAIVMASSLYTMHRERKLGIARRAAEQAQPRP